jgi:hypothetical protein
MENFQKSKSFFDHSELNVSKPSLKQSVSFGCKSGASFQDFSEFKSTGNKTEKLDLIKEEDLTQNNADRSDGYQSDGSGSKLTPEGSRQLAIENIGGSFDSYHLRSSASTYFTAPQSNHEFQRSSTFEQQEEPESSCNTLDTEFRLRWNEPVINWSDSTVSTYWVRNEVVDDSQGSRNSWDTHSARNEPLSRSSTFVYEPDLRPANNRACNVTNDEDSIPPTQPSNIRYGEYLASLNKASSNDHHGSNDQNSSES